MIKRILDLKGAQKLTKNEQQRINGGARKKKCGGDGSFIMQNGKKVCCYVPFDGSYIC